MKTLTLQAPLFGLIVATRAALGFGAGLLLAERIPLRRRRRIGAALVGFGVATTIPAVRAVMDSLSERRFATRVPLPLEVRRTK